MVDTVVIEPLTTIEFKQKTYLPGQQYTVPTAVANALGSSVKVIESKKATVPTDEQIEEKMKDKMVAKSENTMVTGKKNKRIRKK